MFKNFIKKFFWIYHEELFKLSFKDLREVLPKENVTFVKIDKNNYKDVQNIRLGRFYIKDFERMLLLGDYGIYICVNKIPVGYGWAKVETSDDYFFHIKNCYLCRFYTNPDFRGKNLYPATILKLIQIFKNKGFDKFYIAAESSNSASLKGIAKVGFEYQKTLHFYRLLKVTLNKYKLEQ